MTHVPFFLVPLGLVSGFVLGWLLSWMRGSETRRRLRDAKVVHLQFLAYLKAFPIATEIDVPDLVKHVKEHIHDMAYAFTGVDTRALSGKERK